MRLAPTGDNPLPGQFNRLRLISLGTGGTRNFTFDGAGNVITDARTGSSYTYGYNSAGRMDSVSLNGVLQASYQYDYAGRQVLRSLASGVTIQSVFDSMGRRIAEYDQATGALIREYIWMEDEPVAVIEGGVISYVRVDHIGRPVFATDASGIIVWTAAYDPFGTLRASTGTPINLRFPGQWFQAESGLHQNWMRDYDPTTGRYLQADPLGLIDGPSIYGYAWQNPVRWTDPTGEQVAEVVGGWIGVDVAIPDPTDGAWPKWAAYGTILGGAMLMDYCTSCPACRSGSTGEIIPVGSSGHRYQPESRGHWPYKDGQHVHLYVAQQNPNNCTCFWKTAQKNPVDPPPPPGSFDITQHPLVTLWGQ